MSGFAAQATDAAVTAAAVLRVEVADVPADATRFGATLEEALMAAAMLQAPHAPHQLTAIVDLAAALQEFTTESALQGERQDGTTDAHASIATTVNTDGALVRDLRPADAAKQHAAAAQTDPPAPPLIEHSPQPGDVTASSIATHRGLSRAAPEQDATIRQTARDADLPVATETTALEQPRREHAVAMDAATSPEMPDRCCAAPGGVSDARPRAAVSEDNAHESARDTHTSALEQASEGGTASPTSELLALMTAVTPMPLRDVPLPGEAERRHSSTSPFPESAGAHAAPRDGDAVAPVPLPQVSRPEAPMSAAASPSGAALLALITQAERPVAERPAMESGAPATDAGRPDAPDAPAVPHSAMPALPAGVRVLELHAEQARRQIITRTARPSGAPAANAPRTADDASGELAARSSMPSVAADAIEQLRKPVPELKAWRHQAARVKPVLTEQPIVQSGEAPRLSVRSSESPPARAELATLPAAEAEARSAVDASAVRFPSSEFRASGAGLSGASAPLAAAGAPVPANPVGATQPVFGTERISVRIGDEVGAPVVRIAIRGDNVEARIVTSDATLARTLGAHANELAVALEAKGFDQAKVQVRGTGSANEGISPAQLAGPSVTESRDTHQSRPDDQRRSPDERAQAWREDRPDPRRQGRQPRRFSLDDEEQP